MAIKIPEILIGTAIIVLNQNKILLGKRKNSYRSGWYGLPGGRVESSEKLIDCAKRELIEETGLIADSLEYIGVIRDWGGQYTFTHFAFLCKDISGQPENIEKNKCEGWEWYDPGKIPDQTLPSHKAVVDMLLNPDTPRIRDISSE